MLRAAFTRRTVNQIRAFHGSSIYYAASVFKMPAMSPTMSEGGIVSWKVKPGDTFSAGDPILEVELIRPPLMSKQPMMVNYGRF